MLGTEIVRKLFEDNLKGGNERSLLVRRYVGKLRAAFRYIKSAGNKQCDWSLDWNTNHPNSTADDLVSFWQNDQLRNIVPPSSSFPAGFDEAEFLKQVCQLLTFASVVEIGCGFGRLASAFPPEIYKGLDTNLEAIERAKIHRPGYHFELTDFDAVYPQADLYLAYTVFLHIDDKTISDFDRRLRDVCRQLLIVEIMDPTFRKVPSVVPNFLRTRSDYQEIFKSFDLEFEIRKPYKHYPGKDISYLLLANKNNR
jgi:SAM-dependent methyltransferase